MPSLTPPAAEHADIHGLVAAFVDALDPGAEIKLRRALCDEVYTHGRRDGWREGYAQAIADIKRIQQDIYAAVQVAASRHTYDRPALSAEQILHRARESWNTAEAKKAGAA